MDRRLNSRIQHKIDTQENWEKAVNFIPLKGEWIFYDKDAENADIRLKIGDGETNVNELPFVSTSGSDDSQSVQPDYEQNDAAATDYIKNRPFYDLSKEYTFNGEITSDTIVTETIDLSQLMGAKMTFVRLCDALDNTKDLVGMEFGVVELDASGSDIIDEKLIGTMGNQDGVVSDGFPLILNINNPNNLNLLVEDPWGTGEDLSVDFPETGLYITFMQMVDDTGAFTGEAMYVNYLYKIDIKTLDIKYLPKNMALGYEERPFKNIAWDGNPTAVGVTYTATIEGMGDVPFSFYKVSDQVISSSSDLIGAKYSQINISAVNGVEEESNSYVISISSSDLTTIFNSSYACTLDDVGYGFVCISEEDINKEISVEMSGPGVTATYTFPEAGIYFFHYSASMTDDSGNTQSMTSYISGLTTDIMNITKIDEKFLPDGLLTESDKNIANGVAGLDSEGKISADIIPDGIGSQADWNETDSTSPAYIVNRPFGETGFSITWDGTPTDEYVDVTDSLDAILYKVSDRVITKEEMIGSVCYYTIDNFATHDQIQESDIQSSDNGLFYIAFDGNYGLVSVSLQPGSDTFMGVTFSFNSAGTWFIKASNYTPTALYSENYSINRIDEKYLPNTRSNWNENVPSSIAYVANRTHYFYKRLNDITWDGTISSGQVVATTSDPTSGEVYPYKFYKMSDLPSGVEPSWFVGSVIESYQNGSLNTSDPLTDEDIFYNSDGIQVSNLAIFVCYTDNTVINTNDLVELKDGVSGSGLEMTISFPEAGIYLMKINYSSSGYSLNGYVSEFIAPKTYVPLEEGYIPDTIMRVSEYGVAELNSSGKIDISKLPTGNDFNEYQDNYIPTNADVYNYVYNYVTEKFEDLNIDNKANLVDGIVPISELPITDTIASGSAIYIPTTQAIYNERYLSASRFDQPGGVPQLDGYSKIKIAQLPTTSSIIDTSTSIPTTQAVYNALQDKASLEENGTIPISQLPIDEIIAAVIAAIPNGDEVSY